MDAYLAVLACLSHFFGQGILKSHLKLASGRKVLELIYIGDQDKCFFGQIIEEVQIGTDKWQAARDGSSMC